MSSSAFDFGSPFDSSGLIEEFELEVRQTFSSPYAVAVSSGTAALSLALKAHGFGEGDEVLIPAASVVMTVAAITNTGACPVFYDCAPGSAEPSYEHISSLLNERTRSILPVHLWGAMSNMTRLSKFAAEHGLVVVEDACQAHGSLSSEGLAGTVGSAGAISLRRGKLVAAGEGGVVFTRDPEIARRVLALRDHWSSPESPGGKFDQMAFNYRMSETSAPYALSGLKDLPEVLRHRKGVMDTMTLSLAEFGLVPFAGSPGTAPNNYCLTFLLPPHSDGVALCERLASLGVPNSVGSFGLRVPYRWPSVERLVGYADCPNAESLLQTVLPVVMPVWPSEEAVFKALGAIRRELERNRIGG